MDSGSRIVSGSIPGWQSRKRRATRQTVSKKPAATKKVKVNEEQDHESGKDNEDENGDGAKKPEGGKGNIPTPTPTPTEKTTLIDIYMVDKVTKAAQLKKIVGITDLDQETATLSRVRKLLRAQKALGFREKLCSFCTVNGSQIKDTLPFTTYLKVVGHGLPPPGKGKDEPSEMGILTETDGQTHLQVYFLSRKRDTPMDEQTKQFLKDKMDFELKKAEYLPDQALEMLKGSYDHRNFMAEVGRGSIIHPVDMTQEQWYAVTETTAILHGSNVWRATYESPAVVQRGLYSAFKLKKRDIMEWEEGSDIKSEDDSEHESEDGANDKPNDGSNVKSQEANKTPDQKKHAVLERLRIPRFIGDDESSVRVIESKSSVADAIASTSLNQGSAEAAISGGAYGFSVGASGKHEWENSDRSEKRTKEERNHLTIIYNFPRVVIGLDKDSLELTHECKNALRSIKTPADAGEFKRKFGSFFACKVQLGGRLHSTQDSQSVSESDRGEQIRRMKYSASLSFASPAVQASAHVSVGTDSSDKNEHQSATYDSQMAWEANGGDTLLCNNPAAWCSTVSSYYNWRVVEQSGLVSMASMIAEVAKGDPVLGPRLLSFEETPYEDEIKISFYNKSAGKYLGFNGDSDRYPPIIYEDLKNRSQGPPNTGQLFPGGPRKTLTLGVSKEGNAQIFTLKGKMANSEYNGHKYVRLLENEKYTIWNDDIQDYVGTSEALPFGAGVLPRRQLQGNTEKCRMMPIHVQFLPVTHKNEECLQQDTKVNIEVNERSKFWGPVRGVIGKSDAVVVDLQGERRGNWRDTDLKSAEPYEFNLRYYPYSEQPHDREKE